MDPDCVITQLERHHALFAALFATVTPPMQHWRPPYGGWSLLEIACHLLDEEREDFRTRLNHIMADRSGPWPDIDPEAWPRTRDYAARDFATVTAQFLQARSESLSWLRDLREPKWNRSYQHPRFGPMSAEYMLRNWLAHDLLHIRQINRRGYEYLAAHSPQGLDYAGSW